MAGPRDLMMLIGGRRVVHVSWSLCGPMAPWHDWVCAIVSHTEDTIADWFTLGYKLYCLLCWVLKIRQGPGIPMIPIIPGLWMIGGDIILVADDNPFLGVHLIFKQPGFSLNPRLPVCTLW